MIPKSIGLHLANVADLIKKRQGLVVAAGFIAGCLIWLFSWLLDIPKFSLSALMASVATANTDWFTGEWVRNHVASTLIAVSSTFAIILAYLQVTGQHLDQFRARYTLRGHIIICGMSSRGQVLARDLVRQGFDVVIVDLDPAAGTALQQQQAGVCVVLRGCDEYRCSAWCGYRPGCPLDLPDLIRRHELRYCRGLSPTLGRR